MKRKQVYLEDEQERAIKQLARSRGVSEATVIRDAMDRYLHECSEVGPVDEEDPILAIIGIGKPGVTDGSINHDRDLYGAPPR